MPKTCTKCDTAKPSAEFSKNRRAKDGLQSHCKACNRAYQQANRDAILEARRPYADAVAAQRGSYYASLEIQEKECRKCATVKPSTGFAKNSRAGDGLQSYCKECNAVYYREHRERCRERDRVYYENNREDVAARQRDYYRATRRKG